MAIKNQLSSICHYFSVPEKLIINLCSWPYIIQFYRFSCPNRVTSPALNYHNAIVQDKQFIYCSFG